MFLAALNVFFINIATIIGPIPPGTGDINPATWLTLSKSTSPTNFTFPFSSIILLKFASMIHAPDFTNSRRMKFAVPKKIQWENGWKFYMSYLPMEVTMMSAFLRCSSSSFCGVSLWHTVTVAPYPGSGEFWSEWRTIATARPTFFDRPQITTFLDATAIPVLEIFKNCWTLRSSKVLDVEKYRQSKFFQVTLLSIKDILFLINFKKFRQFHQESLELHQKKKVIRNSSQRSTVSQGKNKDFIRKV